MHKAISRVFWVAGILPRILTRFPREQAGVDLQQVQQGLCQGGEVAREEAVTVPIGGQTPSPASTPVYQFIERKKEPAGQ